MSSFDNEIQLSQYENLSKEKKIRKNKKKNKQYIIEMFRKGWRWWNIILWWKIEKKWKNGNGEYMDDQGKEGWYYKGFWGI